MNAAVRILAYTFALIILAVALIWALKFLFGAAL